MAQTPRLSEATEIEFDFEKSNYFRVIHVDGVFGGVSSISRSIHMAIYNERQPIPKKVTHSLEKGMLGSEILAKRMVRSGVFREVEADLVISLETAIAVRTWLDEKITQLQQLNEISATLTPADPKDGK